MRVHVFDRRKPAPKRPDEATVGTGRLRGIMRNFGTNGSGPGTLVDLVREHAERQPDRISLRFLAVSSDGSFESTTMPQFGAVTLNDPCKYIA